MRWLDHMFMDWDHAKADPSMRLQYAVEYAYKAFALWVLVTGAALAVEHVARVLGSH